MSDVERGQTDGYIRRDCSISIGGARLCNLVIVGPAVILIGWVYVEVWGYEETLAEIMTLLEPGKLVTALLLLIIAVVVVGPIVHELLHAVTWVVVGRKRWSAVCFGIRPFCLYAHLKEPLPIWVYRLGTLMPGFLMGLVPALLGVLMGNVWVTLGSMLFILEAGNDFLSLILSRNVPGDRLVEDHPTRVGCYILEPVDKKLSQNCILAAKISPIGGCRESFEIISKSSLPPSTR